VHAFQRATAEGFDERDEIHGRHSAPEAQLPPRCGRVGVAAAPSWPAVPWRRSRRRVIRPCGRVRAPRAAGAPRIRSAPA
jgi:hypothetical protein